MKKTLIETILIIATVLLIIALVVPNYSISLAQKKIQYKVVYADMKSTRAMQGVLDSEASDGWELVGVDGSGFHLIFKK